MIRIGERRPLQRVTQGEQHAFLAPRVHDRWLIKDRGLADYDVLGEDISQAAVVPDGERDLVRVRGIVMVRGARPAPRGAVPEIPLLTRDRAIRIAAGAGEAAVQPVAVWSEIGRGRLVGRRA